MKVCFIVLAHQDPKVLGRLLRVLLEDGNMVAVHLDKKAPSDFSDTLRNDLERHYEKILWADRVSIEWGEWSMVEAVLNGLRAIAKAPEHPDYVYLISGADYPIRPITQLRSFLERNKGREFIESVDAERFRWVSHGIQQERYLFRHWINWRKHPRLHSFMLSVQRIMRMERPFPEPFRPHLGSQWWTLTWATCTAVLELTNNKSLVDFFKTTWVPDELFFQTVVRNLVTDQQKIDNRHLTLYQFTGYGVPLVYYNGHDDYLSRQPFFFARKFSPHASGLRDSMDLRSVNGEVSPLPDDDKVGKVSTDYARFRMTHGRGLFGRRVIGRVRNAWYGDLEWNARPYFVVVGECSRTLQMAQEILNERPDMLCHGELFDATTIRFADNADRFAGYGSGDLRLRDQKPQNFLVDILNESPERLTGYLWLHGPYLESGHPKRLNPRRNMAELHSWDHNANLLVIRRNPEVLFEEALDNKNASNNDDRFLAEGFARFYSGYLDDYFKISEAANCSGAKIRFLYVAHDDEAVLREALGQDSDAQGGATIWPADGDAINARGWIAASEVIRNPELKNIARAVERGYHKRTHGKE